MAFPIKTSHQHLKIPERQYLTTHLLGIFVSSLQHDKSLTKPIMKFLKKSLLALSFMTLAFNAYSQLGITGYSVHAIGVNTNQSKKISGELKTFTNRDFEDLVLETDFFYNFKPSTYHQFSVGLGLNFEPFRGFDYLNAFTIPAKLEIKPLQDFKQLSLLFELTPVLVVEGQAHLRNLWGIRYTFGDSGSSTN